MYKTGLGEDLHRLSIWGKPLILGGVIIPDGRGVIAHSDGDALLHAIIDALLGAAALGDIGLHFPPSDPLWQDADSRQMLRKTSDNIHARGLKIVNIDTVISLQQPRLSPFIANMRRNIADDLSLSQESISVKSKSGEGIGLIGLRRAVAARAIVLLTGSESLC